MANLPVHCFHCAVGKFYVILCVSGHLRRLPLLPPHSKEDPLDRLQWQQRIVATRSFHRTLPPGEQFSLPISTSVAPWITPTRMKLRQLFSYVYFFLLLDLPPFLQRKSKSESKLFCKLAQSQAAKSSSNSSWFISDVTRLWVQSISAIDHTVTLYGRI